MQGGGRGFDSPRLHHLAAALRQGRAPRRTTQPPPDGSADRRGHRGAAALLGGAFTTEERTSANKLQHSWSTTASGKPADGRGTGPGTQGRRNGSRECLTKGQATKGARRMPRRHGPMKDVARLRKAPASCLASSTGDLRMGQPGPLHRGSRPAEHIGRIEGTGGTETSQYPEEKKRFPQ